jgi:hypothetical protein
MKTHGVFATEIAVWLVMLSPVIGLIMAFVSAWVSGQLTG